MRQLIIIIFLLFINSCSSVESVYPIYLKESKGLYDKMMLIRCDGDFETRQKEFNDLDNEIDAHIVKYKYEIDDYEPSYFDCLHSFLFFKKAYFYKINNKKEMAEKSIKLACLYIRSQLFTIEYRVRFIEGCGRNLPGSFLRQSFQKDMNLFTYDNIEKLARGILKDSEDFRKKIEKKGGK